MQLDDRPFLMSDVLTAADMQMWFAMRIASPRQAFGNCPALHAYLDRLEELPSAKAAVLRSGPVGMNQ